MRRELHSVRESQFVRHRRKDTGDALLLRVRRTAGITTIWRNGLVPWMLMVNKRLQKFSCRLAVQDQVSWMAFSPGDKRNTAKVAKDTSTSPLSSRSNRGARHQRFGTGTTSDRTPGPRAGTSPCHCPIADPHRPVPCTTQTVHRGTVNVGTWNVRGLKVKHVHKPVDVSLTH
jgi:hypothetical protein